MWQYAGRNNFPRIYPPQYHSRRSEPLVQPRESIGVTADDNDIAAVEMCCEGMMGDGFEKDDPKLTASDTLLCTLRRPPSRICAAVKSIIACVHIIAESIGLTDVVRRAACSIDITAARDVAFQRDFAIGDVAGSIRYCRGSTSRSHSIEHVIFVEYSREPSRNFYDSKTEQHIGRYSFWRGRRKWALWYDGQIALLALKRPTKMLLIYFQIQWQDSKIKQTQVIFTEERKHFRRQ